MPTQQELDRGYRIGEWEIVPRRRILKRGDEEVQPEPKVYGCLNALALRDGDAVSRDELAQEVWDGRFVADEAITRCIKELRRHFGDRQPFRYVKALHGVGYMLLQPVRLNEPDEPAPPGLPPSEPKPDYRKRFFGAVAIATIVLAWALWPAGPPAEKIRIGVMPFENVGDPQQAHLAHGFKMILIETLHSAPNLSVINIREPAPGASAVEVARRTNVDNVLTGQVQAVADDLKVTYELASGRTGETLDADSVTGRVAHHFDMQVELANKVRTKLFGERSKHLVSASRPSTNAAYDAYLHGLYAMELRFNERNLEDAIAGFTETIRLDPDFGPAYLQLATAYALLPVYRGDGYGESLEQAVEVVEQGIAVDPSIEPAAGAINGFYYHQNKEWAKAQLAFQKAVDAEIVDSNAFIWYSRMLASVGRLEAARDVALTGWKLDPDNTVINSRMALAYSWLGETEKAAEYFERSRRLGAQGTTHLMAHALFLARQGNIEASSEVAKRAAGNEGLPPGWIDAVLAGMQDPVYRDAAVDAVNAVVADGNMPANVEIVVRTLLGDLDTAMQLAAKLTEPGEYFEMDLLWIPEFLPLRQREDFRELMDTLGISEYWKLQNCKFVDASVTCPSS
ncbi:MAG: winged helix-turn-helix domain-containing protein [Woeseiaceae bacterium]|nr:winged helix-turn-helix domain-containing protein [Woeseiaceae bacterium]